MNGIEPLINLLIVLTALSVAAERITNIWKLQSPAMRTLKGAPDKEKDRERAIAGRVMLVGIGLALVLKADLIAILRRLDAPWDTLGWFQMRGSIPIIAPEVESVLGVTIALLGCVATGVSLGFGSKFWHDLLDTFLELRNMARNKNLAAPASRTVSKRAVADEEPDEGAVRDPGVSPVRKP